MLQLSHLDQNDIVKVKRKLNVYLSHIENWKTENKRQASQGTAPLQATVRATGMFVRVPFYCPCFCLPDSSCSSVHCGMMSTVYK